MSDTCSSVRVFNVSTTITIIISVITAFSHFARYKSVHRLLFFLLFHCSFYHLHQHVTFFFVSGGDICFSSFISFIDVFYLLFISRCEVSGMFIKIFLRPSFTGLCRGCHFLLMSRKCATRCSTLSLLYVLRDNVVVLHFTCLQALYDRRCLIRLVVLLDAISLHCLDSCL